MADETEKTPSESKGTSLPSGKSGAEKKEGEEEQPSIGKSGYGKEYKKQDSLGEREYTHKQGERGWEREKPEKPEEGPERKITIFQHTFADPEKNRGYWGHYEKWGDQTKRDEEGKFFTKKAELGEG